MGGNADKIQKDYSKEPEDKNKGQNSNQAGRDPNKKEPAKLPPRAPGTADSTLRASHAGNSSKIKKSSMAGLTVQEQQGMLRESHLGSTKVRSGKDGERILTDKNGESQVYVKQDMVYTNPPLGQEPRDFLKGFEDDRYADKTIRKFELSAIIQQKDLIKESNYFDESRDDGRPLQLSTKPSQADFRTGGFDAFQTCQIKTFLFDRQLTDKIIA